MGKGGRDQPHSQLQLGSLRGLAFMPLFVSIPHPVGLKRRFWFVIVVLLAPYQLIVDTKNMHAQQWKHSAKLTPDCVTKGSLGSYSSRPYHSYCSQSDDAAHAP